MMLALLLPWFPIILAVGVGGRLLGRSRGFALGLMCGMFWIVLVQASAGTGVWRQPWVVATMLIGAAAIFLMGGWAGSVEAGPLDDLAPNRTRSVSDGLPAKIEDRSSKSEDSETPMSFRSSIFDLRSSSSTGAPEDETPATAGYFDRSFASHVAAVIQQFDDWLVEHRDDADPWPLFGEFLRGVLFQCCRATHVKPYRLLSEGEELAPLQSSWLEPDPFTEGQRVSARLGLLGHVVTTGRSYVAGDRTHGELIEQLAQNIGPTGSISWCFAITQGTQRLGAVTAGQLDPGGAGIPADNLALLRAVEQLVSQCWCLLAETVHSRTAGQDDPVSGLYNRAAFLQAAKQSLRESYAQGEPAAIAVIAVEGIRELNDAGRWEVADELVREVADSLRRKVRMDDRLGRFDGSRFIWLLRRVDAELASLIVKQVMSRLTTLCEKYRAYRTDTDSGGAITVRCGVVGSGASCKNPDLRTLVSHALVQSRRARLEQVTIAGELDAAETSKR